MSLDGNSLLLSLAIGCVGLAFFVYGKRQGRFPQMIAGATLMIYPYFVPDPLVMAIVGAAISLVLWVVVRLGG